MGPTTASAGALCAARTHLIAAMASNARLWMQMQTFAPTRLAERKGLERSPQTYQLLMSGFARVSDC